ncbi:MAG: hypothetical protein IJ445_00450 [Clostridia bacterium]|nr:hypothetical protein [Clostridia bacterium]
MLSNKVNYKKGTKYRNMQKEPKKQLLAFKWLTKIVSDITLHKRLKIKKVNMEGVKAPYFLLSNHMGFVDLEINALAAYPARVSHIATLEGHYRRSLLMELDGCIGKRKFTTDPHLIPACEKVLNKFGAVLTMYPEARYSPIGTLAILPSSLGQLIKRLKHDVVVLVHHGNYLHTPFWDWRRKRDVPLCSVMTRVLTKEQVEELSAEEIQDTVTKALWYDEYKYQKDNNIRITEPYRAEGLHKVLYQCPICKTEFKMYTEGAILGCSECGHKWELTEIGELKAIEGETVFSHPPTWYEWQRANVRKEIDEGRYSFTDEVDVFSLPNTNNFIDLGKARLTHSMETGFVIEGHYNGEDYKISRPVAGMYGVHIEYDYCYIRPEECVQISTSDDTFVCFPSEKNQVTKLSIATEELYKVKTEEKRLKRLARKLAKESETNGETENK